MVYILAQYIDARTRPILEAKGKRVTMQSMHHILFMRLCLHMESHSLMPPLCGARDILFDRRVSPVKTYNIV